MARHNLSALVRYLRQLAGSAQGDGASDAELLERYVRCRDEAAFELLLWRHGAMVFNVCRRILPREQDAEDAFQATFLAFVRKAGSISRRGSVAAWLYKVAYRIALAAKARAQKTAAREKPDSETLAAAIAPEPSWAELRPILDEEVNRLPERLRRPIVLCYLEGKSNEEAARQLGCPAGTIYSRLARGGEMLRRCLQRRGVTLSVAALTAALAAHVVEAMPAAALLATTLRSALLFAAGQTANGVSVKAAALAEGVLRTMFVTKLKLMALMVLVVSVAAGVWTYGRTAAPQAEAKAENPPPKPAGGDKKDAEPIAVKVVQPKKGGLPQTVVKEAGTDVAQRQQLVPLVSGTVKEVAVDVGDPVRKGQELIRLDAPLVLNEVEQAKAALDIAQARMEEVKIKIDSAQQLAKQHVISSSEVDIHRAALKAAQANVRLAQVALDKAKIQKSFTRLIAEFDGVVSERNCDPGNFVQGGANGTRKPLLTLVRVDRLRVVVELWPYFAGVAERGDPVVLGHGIKSFGDNKEPPSLQGDPKDFITGKIACISPVVDRANGMRTVIIDVANPKNRLVPGESIYALIFFNKTRVPDALTVPRSCVVQGKRADGKDFVYVVRDGKAHVRTVKIGNVLDDRCDVIEGIRADDVVIIKPGLWNDGTSVKIDKAP
ncbi:MAG TPA: efflux RND transporter periplasmic adaptor subunit [Gemmataceae bacterium]|nr:efflux RND transporter periplasmic adaptor subunit [Gemmataceae bacterium]